MDNENIEITESLDDKITEVEVLFDDSGFVNGYNFSTNSSTIGGEIFDLPDDLDDFEINFFCYKKQDKKLVKDEDEKKRADKEAQIEEIRKRRVIECFSIIDRSRLWYDTLSNDQYKELDKWYQAWLEAPETLVIPKKPEWIKEEGA